jgi:hypothetical protein
MATMAIQAAPQQGQMMTVSEQMQYAQMLSKGSLVPRDYRGNPANVLIAMSFGQSMGLSPAESLYRITVIQGRPTASSELIAANVRRAGHRLHIIKDDKTLTATCEIRRADDPDFPFRATWDMAKAKQAGLAGKDNWRKYPMAMLKARAITECAREACSEALYGCVYTAEEMGSATDSGGMTVEVVDEPQQAQEAPQQPVQPQQAAPAPQAEEPGLKPAQKRLGDALRRARDMGFSVAELRADSVEMYGAELEQLSVRQLVEFTELVNAKADGYEQGQTAC